MTTKTPEFTSKQTTTLSSTIALGILHFFGWKVRFNGLPADRGVMIFYPHTSNWDFILGILVKWSISVPLRFLVKEKLFQGISGFFLGRFMRYCGGEPVERSVSSGAITNIVKRMQAANWFWLVITPEGTRSFKPYWRTGFYHMALSAKVPVVCAFVDYPSKEIGVTQVLDLTGDEAVDLANLQAIYEKMNGKHPQQQGTITFKR